MREVAAVFRREFAAYFATPLAAVFLAVFLVLAAALPFQLGGFYESGQADLSTFFAFHPWLYLFFAPAVAMRLWAEERKAGTLELLLTLPLSTAQAVVGKFLAAWAFVGLSLALTFPMWITVNYLGEPDNGAILAAYLGSFLMAGAFLAVGGCLSAATRSQVVAYVLAVAICLLLLLAGHDLVLAAVRAWAPDRAVDAVAALSFLTHFQAIARGVLDLADLAFFLLTIALWLAATARVVDLGRSEGDAGRLRGGGGARDVAALAGLALAFLLLPGLAGGLLRGLRADLTTDRLYSLSEGSRRLVAGLEAPVRLELFLSAELGRAEPVFRAYGARVRHLLEELVAASGGRLSLVVTDPEPFSADEDRAAEFGLEPLPAPRGGQALYFGLVASRDPSDRAVLPLLQPQRERFLEYDVARLLLELDRPERPVVGLLSGLPMAFGFDLAGGRMREPWAIVEQMQQLFTVRSLDADVKTIPDDLDVLMVVHPKHLPEATLYALDQYALRGGRLLVFVDPSAEQDPAGANPLDPFGGDGRASDLGPLAAAWGVEFDASRVVGDARYALTVQGRDGPVGHLAFLGIEREGLAADDPITAALDLVTFATAGAIAPRADAGLTFEPLVTSSTSAAPLDSARFEAPGEPEALFDGFAPTGERYVLAARLGGRPPSAWPEGPPAGATAPADGHLPAAREDLRAILVADTDVLADPLWTRATSFGGRRLLEAWAGNGDFVLNALDLLAGSDALIGLRGRASFLRPFDRVEALRRSADERLRARQVALERELAATEQRLLELERDRKDASSPLPSAEQAATLERFREERARVRRELRDLRHELDRDIDRLGARLKWINAIAAPAMFISLLLLLAAGLRRRHRGAAA